MTREEILQAELELSKTFTDIYRRSFELCNRHLALMERQNHSLMNENEELRRNYANLIEQMRVMTEKRIE